MRDITGKHSGKIVETSKGQKGYVYNHKAVVNGKIAVYLINVTDGATAALPILCTPNSLKTIGFFD